MPDETTSPKTDYVYEQLSNYEPLYNEAVSIAKRCIRRQYTPKQSGNAFQAVFSHVVQSSEYRSYTRGTSGRLDWAWIAGAFMESITSAQSVE